MSEQKRKPVAYRLKQSTVEEIKKMARENNTSQGRIIDNIVAEKKIKEVKDA